MCNLCWKCYWCPLHLILSSHSTFFAYFGLFPFHSSCVSVIWTWTSPNRLSTQLFSPQDDYSLCSVHSLWYVLATSLCVCIALSYLFCPFLDFSACLCEACMYMCKCTCLSVLSIVSHGKILSTYEERLWSRSVCSTYVNFQLKNDSIAYLVTVNRIWNAHDIDSSTC